MMATVSEYQSKIISIEYEIEEKKKDLQNLIQFKEQHSKSISTMTEHFSFRNQRLSSSDLDKNKMKIFNTYQAKMQEMLKAAPEHITKRETEQHAIITAISRIEQEIEQLISEKALCNTMITELKIQEQLKLQQGG